MSRRSAARALPPQRPFEEPSPGNRPTIVDPAAGEPATIRESRRAGTVALILLVSMVLVALLAALV